MCIPGGGGGGGRLLRISSDSYDRSIFLGLKFSIPGFFWVGKFGKYFFGWLDLSRDFFGYSKQSEDLYLCPRIPATLSFCVMLLLKQKMFLGVSTVLFFMLYNLMLSENF